MKFKTQSGCKLLSISLCDEREYLGLSLRNRSFGAVIRIRLDAMSGPIRKLIGPAKTRLQCYVEEASSLPSSAVEEKTVTEDELRVEEVIARINTNVSLLERSRVIANLLKDLKTEEKVNRENKYQRVAEGSDPGYNEILMEANELVARLETHLKVIARIGQQARTKVLSER